MSQPDRISTATLCSANSCTTGLKGPQSIRKQARSNVASASRAPSRRPVYTRVADWSNVVIKLAWEGVTRRAAVDVGVTGTGTGIPRPDWRISHDTMMARAASVLGAKSERKPASDFSQPSHELGEAVPDWSVLAGHAATLTSGYGLHRTGWTPRTDLPDQKVGGSSPPSAPANPRARAVIRPRKRPPCRHPQSWISHSF